MAASLHVPPPPATGPRAKPTAIRGPSTPPPIPTSRPIAAAPKTGPLARTAIATDDWLPPASESAVVPAVAITELSVVDMQVAIPSVPLPTIMPPPPIAESDDAADWDALIAAARQQPTAVARPPRAQVSGVSAGMTDRMRAIEAPSTIAPFQSGASGGYAGDSFAAIIPPRTTPARVGIVSALASAIAIVIVYAVAAGSPTSQPEIVVERPVEVVHAAAAFTETLSPPAGIEDEEPEPDKERARKLALLGLRALDEGRPATAKRMLDKAHDENPNSRPALEGLGRIALEGQRFADAVTHLRKAVKIEPRKAENRRLLGDAYAGQGRTDRARKQYEKGVFYGDPVSSARLAALSANP